MEPLKKIRSHETHLRKHIYLHKYLKNQRYGQYYCHGVINTNTLFKISHLHHNIFRSTLWSNNFFSSSIGQWNSVWLEIVWDKNMLYYNPTVSPDLKWYAVNPVALKLVKIVFISLKHLSIKNTIAIKYFHTVLLSLFDIYNYLKVVMFRASPAVYFKLNPVNSPREMYTFCHDHRS